MRIKEKCEQGSRTGLGITGLGDILTALGIRYGLPKSITMAERVQRTLAVVAYRSSVQLAKERGAFPMFDAEKEQDHPFINRIRYVDPDLVEEMYTYGRRNIALLTIAPTGTTSLLAQTTSGVEPVFRLYYLRRKKVIDVKAAQGSSYFVDDNGDAYEEYPGFSSWF